MQRGMVSRGDLRPVEGNDESGPEGQVRGKGGLSKDSSKTRRRRSVTRYDQYFKTFYILGAFRKWNFG
jgi:hypothetical protein